MVDRSTLMSGRMGVSPDKPMRRFCYWTA